MDMSTLAPSLVATPFATRFSDLAERLLPVLGQLGQLLEQFAHQPVTPQTTCQFEVAVNSLLRQTGRHIVEWMYNHVEAEEAEQLPAQITWDGETYRRRRKSPNRSLACLFGPIRLWRYRYEPLEARERSFFPLEMRLGIEAGLATPALAERVGQASVQGSQAQVQALLRRDHDVRWGTKTLRKVTRGLSEGMAAHREPAQVKRILHLLKQAEASTGPHRPVVSAGRDGIFLPLRGQPQYREGATGTVSVLDRRGKRLGTVYLGRMPEPGQKTLSRQMTSLLLGVLTVWPGVAPVLQYVTDAGHHPTKYFKEVLRRMMDPRHPGRRLDWIWVVDFYHACTYISKMAEALFGTTRRSYAWAHQMRRWLKGKRHGMYRVLHSAAALRRRRKRSGRDAKAYRKAYRYLKKRMKFMDYVSYRRRGLAIGSGITEAACKTVFTQRMKQSGMTWLVEGGQVIVDLRVIYLSRIWAEVHEAYLESKPLPEWGTERTRGEKTAKKAA
jgi:hypothetical protein